LRLLGADLAQAALTAGADRKESAMPRTSETRTAREEWRALSPYGKFEHLVLLVLSGLIAIVVIAALWNLVLKLLASVLLMGTFDPTDHAIFQGVFGMILTVIIALEFKRSLLVAPDHGVSVVHVRGVLLIAMLAIVRKLIVLDLSTADADLLLALAAAILALGSVYWLVRDQDRREADRRASIPA
jgi:uncharacterized membrane protein (DUF373 family)